MQKHLTITILGTGYVGLPSAAIFAAAGNHTFIIDPNQERLDAVREGRSFFFEDGLDPLVAAGLKSGMLVPTADYAEAVPESDIIMSCVGTPDNPDGSSNLLYVFAAAREAAKHMKDGAIFVQKSTVPVGTGERIKKEFAKTGKTLHYVSNPEFLREGTALLDSLWFDRIVAGGDSKEAVDQVFHVYHHVTEHRDEIAKAAGIKAPKGGSDGEYIATNLASAELTKVTANAFLALKISFANSIAKLADKTGADIGEVMNAVGADNRIGRAFLNAGRGYGGGCFPKDVSGLLASGLEHGVELDIMQSAQAVNESMPGYIIEKLRHHFKGGLADKRVAILGLAFKVGTSDTRRSPGVALANVLAEKGAIVTVYDPQAMEEAETNLKGSVIPTDSINEALMGVQAVVVATDWPEFLDYPTKDYAKLLGENGIFVDAMNRFDMEAITKTGLRYIGVGRGE